MRDTRLKLTLGRLWVVTALCAPAGEPQPRNDTWLYECETRQWRPGRPDLSQMKWE